MRQLRQFVTHIDEISPKFVGIEGLLRLHDGAAAGNSSLGDEAQIIFALCANEPLADLSHGF